MEFPDILTTHVLQKIKAAPPVFTDAQAHFTIHFEEHVLTSTPGRLGFLAHHAYFVKSNFHEPEDQRLELGLRHALGPGVELIVVYVRSSEDASFRAKHRVENLSETRPTC
jgi:hypothetical protein